MTQQSSGEEGRIEARPIVREGGGRGFASMTPERQRAIASAGGRAAHARGTAHEFTPEEARKAARARLQRIR